MRSLLPLLTLIVLPLSSPDWSEAQEPYRPSSLTAQDYARAESFLGENLEGLAMGVDIRPNVLPDGRFWYRNAFADGYEFIMVDPEARTRERAFNHDRLARGISTVTGRAVEPFDLPFTTFELVRNARAIGFNVDDEGFICDLRGYVCERGEVSISPDVRRRFRALEVLSPDGTKAAFIRDHNLWMRYTATGQVTQLTLDE